MRIGVRCDMHDILAFLNINVEMIKGSAAEPVFLVCILFAVVAALALTWGSGIIVVMLVAAARTGMVDWEHFAPGVPPSPSLLYVFSATLLAAVAAFVAVKLLRALWRGATRNVSWKLQQRL
jgi:hypothetical protein